MKSLLIPIIIHVVLLISPSNNLISQETWTMEWVSPKGEQWNSIIVICGDTIINNKSYDKIYTCGNCNTPSHLRFKENNVEYIINLNNDTELLKYYDYNLSIGDTIRSPLNNWLFTVSMIDSIQINTEFRKRFTLRTGFSGIDIWIEDIGSIEGGYLNPMELYGGSGVGPFFVCYNNIEKNIVHLGTQRSIDECLINLDLDICKLSTSTNEETYESNKFKIFPNPAFDEISIINNSDFGSIKYKVFNLLGEEILWINSNKLKSTINLTEIEAGLYILKVLSKNKVLQTSWITKM